MMYRIESTGYKKTFDKERAARTTYNSICKEIEEEQEGFVRLYQKESAQDEWQIIEEFELG